MSTKQSTTIRLSDTHDQYARRVHVNVRDSKVTMVYRWKDSTSPKAHTQRMTLDDNQAARLTGALIKAFGAAADSSEHPDARLDMFANIMNETALG